MTTTEGHERLERARDRFAQAANEEPQRKRLRPEGEGEQSLAPSASGVRSNHQEGGSSSSGPALPLPPAPPPLVPPPLAKRSLEQETEMTDAAVEQTGRVKEAQGASRSASSCGQQEQ